MNARDGTKDKAGVCRQGQKCLVCFRCITPHLVFKCVYNIIQLFLEVRVNVIKIASFTSCVGVSACCLF